MKRNTLFGCLALVCAIVAGVLAFAYLSLTGLAGQRQIDQKVKALGGKTILPVPARSIPAFATITEDMLTKRGVITIDVHPQAITDKKDIVGKVALATLYQGEQILKGRVGESKASGGAAKLIEEDKVAIAIAVTEISGVGGGVRPGDRVDILSTSETNTDILFEDIYVIGVGGQFPFGGVPPVTQPQTTGEAGFGGATAATSAPSTRSVILEVTPDQAKEITFAAEKTNIKLALRPSK